jgi:hypothetical protein
MDIVNCKEMSMNQISNMNRDDIIDSSRVDEKRGRTIGQDDRINRKVINNNNNKRVRTEIDY